MPPAQSSASHLSSLSVLDDTGQVVVAASAKARKKAARAAAKASRGGGAGVGPWIVTLLIAASAGVGGHYLWQRAERAEIAAGVFQVDNEKLRLSAESANNRASAITAELETTKGKVVLSTEALEAKAAAIDKLQQKLQSLVSVDQGEVVTDGDSISLQLVDKVLFKLGEADLTPQGLKVLEQVGAALNEFPDKQVFVQGHTDDVPIKKDNGVFASNWELSATRALNVVHYLQDTAKVDPSRLAAVAFSEYRPVSKTKKAKNRRIEIVLYPKLESAN